MKVGNAIRIFMHRIVKINEKFVNAVQDIVSR